MLAIIAFGFLMTFILSDRIQRVRKNLSDSISAYSRFMVRFLMNKFEIMQTNKVAYEINELQKLKE